MSPRPRQLALALDHAESYAREDFVAGPGNEGALRLIESWPGWTANTIALIGPEGSGKTHLATIWAAAAGARVIAGRALGVAELPHALATGALVIEDAAAATQMFSLLMGTDVAPRRDFIVAGAAELDPARIDA